MMRTIKDVKVGDVYKGFYLYEMEYTQFMRTPMLFEVTEIKDITIDSFGSVAKSVTFKYYNDSYFTIVNTVLESNYTSNNDFVIYLNDDAFKKDFNDTIEEYEAERDYYDSKVKELKEFSNENNVNNENNENHN